MTAPETMPCPSCDGIGFVTLGCPRCAGSGEGMRDGWRCSTCRGAGASHTECEECAGEGVVEAYDYDKADA